MALSTMWPCGRSGLAGGGVGGAAGRTACRRENARSVGRRRRSDMMRSLRGERKIRRAGIRLLDPAAPRRNATQGHDPSVVLPTADPLELVLKGDQVKRDRYDWRDRYS